MGARSNGIGYASSCISDEWAMFNNIGGLAQLENTTTAFSYDAHPSIKSFNRMAALFATPLKFGVAGFSVFRFGDNLYSEQIASLAFSNSFGIASIGLKINYIQYRAEGYGTRGALSVSFGGVTRLTSKLRVGTYITNLNQPEIDHSTGEHLPTRLTAGLSFNPSEHLTIATEIEKDLEHECLWKTGLEYKLDKKFSARTGFNLNPDAAFMGFGFKSKRFTLDYAYQYNVLLGSSHQATIGYPFIKKKK